MTNPAERRPGRGGASENGSAPMCIFFSFPTLSTALASNQTEADGGGLHRYGGESNFLPSAVTHARRHSGINQYLGRGRGGSGNSGEGVLAAAGLTTPPGGTRDAEEKN